MSDYNYNNQTAYPDTYSITKPFSRENRFASTDAESVMWETVRRKALGVKFRRQHVIGDYIADFICIEKKLIIEIDGMYHNKEEQQKTDLIRTDWLNKQGYYVLRFTNIMVLTDLEYVKSRIIELLTKL